MSGKPGTIFVRAGHEVGFSYARSEKKLEGPARDARRNARAGAPGTTIYTPAIVFVEGLNLCYR